MEETNYAPTSVSMMKDEWYMIASNNDKARYAPGSYE